MLLVIRQSLVKYYWQLLIRQSNDIVFLPLILRMHCEIQPIGMYGMLAIGMLAIKTLSLRCKILSNLIGRSHVHILMFLIATVKISMGCERTKVRRKIQNISTYNMVIETEKETLFYQSLWTNLARCGSMHK